MHVQGPLCVLDLVVSNSVSDSYGTCKLNGTLVPPAIVKSEISWDTGSDFDSAVNGQTYFMPILSSTTECQSLVLQPTGLALGQFRRLGMIHSECNALGQLLNSAIQPRLVAENSFLRFDSEKGFVIEII